MQKPPPFDLEPALKAPASRERAVHILAEACELEHNILCSYLYAAFSLKEDCREDLSPAELRAVKKWRGELMVLCIEEMVHLAQVANLMVSLGARPHFNRPNLPVAPGYHPAGIAISLAPFSLEALDHFLYLERPGDVELTDPKPYRAAASAPRPRPGFAPLMPRAPQYGTIGEFYDALRQELETTASVLGEQRLFSGPSSQQMTGKEINSSDLVVIQSLADAKRAIDFIIEQGEGSSARRNSSHFARFEAMREELVACRAQREDFEPARPVARDPVMHPPAEGEVRVWITEERAAMALDAGNAAYGAMLSCLASVYEVPQKQAVARQRLIAAAMACMGAVAQVGQGLTRMPASDCSLTPHAGLTFAMPRAIEGALHPQAASLLAERLSQIGARLRILDVPNTDLQAAAQHLSQAAADLLHS